MRILYGICNMGLGHATRDLPLIKALIERGDEIYILSTGNAMSLLKKELGTKVKEYIDYPGYPPLERNYGSMSFYFLLMSDLVRTGKTIIKERIFTGKLVRRFGIEKIITDGRYGVFSLKAPSFIISHQLHFETMLFKKLSEKSTELANSLHFRNFTKILIPDFANFERSLSGKLSHNIMLIPQTRIRYIGILSSYRKAELPKDIDYLFIISGFIKEKKNSFVSKLFEQAKELDGKKVFVLGNPEENKVIEDKEHNITAYSYVSGEKRIELMNRTEFIVSRAGYTTIMDLAELEKKALLVPTPGMSEQQYLARFHKSKATLYSVSQDEINLLRDIKIAKNFTGIKPIHKTGVSVKNFLRAIDSVK